MIVIYAEKASLAKAIAVALKAGNRIVHPKEPTIGHYKFTINGEKTILCHGVGHLCGLVDAKVYGEQYAVWNTDTLSCPFCGARVIKKYGYFCSAKRDTGCPFSVGKEYCGKAISDAQAIRLIEKGKTTLIKGFKRKDGKGEFDAYLVVDKAAKKIKFEFPVKNTK